MLKYDEQYRSVFMLKQSKKDISHSSKKSQQSMMHVCPAFILYYVCGRFYVYVLY